MALLERLEMTAAEAWAQLEVALERGAAAAELSHLHDLIKREGERLTRMSYEQLVEDRSDFLGEPAEHPSGEAWGNDWPAELAVVLRNAPVRKRHEVAGRTMVTCGKVVGCVDHFFQIVYENTHFESRSWHDLRNLLVAHPSLDGALGELLSRDEGYLARASRRPKKKRDLDEEDERFLPREGCHHSLPPDKVACHLHEELRLSGLVPYDTGPAVSD